MSFINIKNRENSYRENSYKEAQLKFLDETCKGVKERNGTLKIFLSYEHCIVRQIERCYGKGATVEEVKKILTKYE